ncbi:hypothetical protein C8R45DRAFT_908206 [Mycena sanguinolenta]|nr:hypothetical protein C8R45DRAFT_908206 [Mycena sanguinolenta]
MHQFFAEDTGKQKIYVLYGLGGAGKTQIALKFIEEWSQLSFTDRLLVDASTTETIDTHLKNIAAIKQTGNSVQDGLSWLIGNREEWLLFFDNADDPAINLNQFFPKCNHGNIIITSRNPNLRVYGMHSLVSDMDEPDAVALLLNSAQQEASETNNVLALDIVKALWYLPLAIVQAGAFIFESGTLDTYLDLFRKNQTELLKKKSVQGHDDYAWAVYTTWEMSFRKLSQPAAMLLQLCSLLHRDNIFEEIFSRAAKVLHLGSSHSECSSEIEITKAKKFLSQFVRQTGEWDSLQFLKITNELRVYSLINFDQTKKSFSIHPLVHSWSQTTLNDAESYHLCIHDILSTSIQGIPQQDMELASLRFVSHVDSIVSKNNHFALQYANIYYCVGRYTDAENLDVTQVQKQRDLLGDDHPKTLDAMQNLAKTYTKMGHFEKAIKLHAVVLEKQRQVLGDDHLDTLNAMHGLGTTYYYLGRFNEAEKLQVVILEKWRKLLGDDHPNTLNIMHNLANTYHGLGRFDEAEKLQVVVLEKRRKLLGDDHLHTLDTMHALAVTYYSLKRFNEAEKLQVVVVEKRRKHLGDDHPNTLNTMHDLGNTYYCLGRFDEAEKLQVVVLEKRRKLLGDDHLDTLNAMYSLAITYHSLGRFDEAEKLEVVVLEKQRKLLGDDHLHTLNAMHDLAITYYDLDRFDEAEKLQVVVLEKRRKLLGDGHMRTQVAIQNLAQTYRSLSKETEAAEIESLLPDQ